MRIRIFTQCGKKASKSKKSKIKSTHAFHNVNKIFHQKYNNKKKEMIIMHSFRLRLYKINHSQNKWLSSIWSKVFFSHHFCWLYDEFHCVGVCVCIYAWFFITLMTKCRFNWLAESLAEYQPVSPEHISSKRKEV